ncbi:hypothetical protein Ga0074812_107156 [Parafrankia irregularis]|uniref:Bacterial repeat domain-containing protein n=1 Tax=Parafrankia irregularis TaxID=795642 RepID=A0A0S4QL30_9ACTN|nr:MULTISPECIES: hypothetical protein [Parafrankia]MBE3201280.1 hypothetical protein [Parafrankia sp. CH37]CUU56272.1 hypothetical protein Ga0074812_107156 [Parafrankia irregularis]
MRGRMRAGLTAVLAAVALLMLVACGSSDESGSGDGSFLDPGSDGGVSTDPGAGSGDGSTSASGDDGRTYTLSVSTEGGEVLVESSRGTVRCPPNCTFQVASGRQITLVATEPTSEVFGRWEVTGAGRGRDTCAGTRSLSCTITITGDVTALARYGAQPDPVTEPEDTTGPDQASTSGSDASQEPGASTTSQHG